MMGHFGGVFNVTWKFREVWQGSVQFQPEEVQKAYSNFQETECNHSMGSHCIYATLMLLES